MLLFPLQQLFYRESLCVGYLADEIPACDSLSFLSHLPENLVVLAASNCNSWQCKIILWNCPGRDSVLSFRTYQHQWWFSAMGIQDLDQNIRELSCVMALCYGQSAPCPLRRTVSLTFLQRTFTSWLFINASWSWKYILKFGMRITIKPL